MKCKNCKYSSLCESRWIMGVYKAYNKIGKPKIFCLGYDPKFYRFWDKQEGYLDYKISR